MTGTRRWRAAMACGLAVLMGLVWCGEARAEAAPPADLARLVPPSVVTLIRLSDPGALWKEGREGPIGKRLLETGAWRRFAASDGYLKMAAARDELRRLYDFDVAEALVAALGREIVLTQALEGREGAQKPYPYLFMARAASAERLAAVADRLRTIRTETGELKSSVKHEYRNWVIYEEVSVPRRGPQAGGEKTIRYCLVGDVLLASERMGPLKAALDRLVEASGGGSLADSPRYQAALEGVPEGCAVTAYVDAAALIGRAGVLKRASDAARNPGLRRLLGGMERVLSAADTVTLWARAGDGLEVRARTRLVVDKLDPAARAFLTVEPAAHQAWRVLPPDTLLAVSTRADFKNLAALGGGALTPPAAAARLEVIKRMLGGMLGGLDVDQEVIPNLGPEVVVAVTRQPVPEGGPVEGAASGLAATVLVQVTTEGDLATRLQTVLGTLAWTAVTGNNKDPQKSKLVLGTERVADVPVTYVDFAEGHPLKGTLSPCCAKVGPFVAVSTSRSALRDIIQASQGASLADSAAFRNHLGRSGGQARCLLYVSGTQLAGALRDNVRALAAAQAEKTRRAVEDVRQDLSALAELLELMEAVTLVRTTAPDEVRGVLTLTLSAGAQ